MSNESRHTGKYPECEKMQLIVKESNSIGHFIDWALNKGYLKTSRYFNHEKVLAEYFEIDLNKVEKERIQMFEEIQKTNAEARNG